ncbi:pyruvate dehydrogenase (acetyl-transferring) E1 component subunit alpha [Candidatus Aenigmatarchaeota archaeon]
MPQKKIGSFSVDFLQILDENGKCDSKLMPKLDNEQIRKMYEYMVTTRLFDDKALNLQKQGRMGTWASSLGEEASHVGTAFALAKDDWLFPSFREHGAYIARNYPMHMLYQFWGGDEKGEQVPENMNVFTAAIPVGTQITHAVGTAWAMKIKKKKSATMVYFGDGATSKGDFHEGLNFSGVFKAPVIFVCSNNQYAISIPVKNQTAAKTIAQKALAYGINGIRVDGNDVFAVYAATQEALKRAKEGKGATLLECFTYRVGHHTTSDDSARYRSQKEVDEWKKKDPIERLRRYMVTKKIWNKKDEATLREEAKKMIESIVQKYESLTPPAIEDIFSYTYKEMTPQLKEQLEELKEVEKNDNNEHGSSDQ